MSNGRDTRRVCRISLPTTSIFGGHKRDTLVHFSGIIFFLGWWVFLDSVFQSSLSTIENPNPVSVQFSDWLPGLCSTLGMIIVNLIDKERLADDEGSASAYRVRAALFVGFALLAGGVAGGITVLVIKYGLRTDGFGLEWGIANVVQNVAILLSATILWNAQSTEDYEYNLTL